MTHQVDEDGPEVPADATTVEKVRTEVRREIMARDGYLYWLEDDALGAVCQRMAGTS